MASSWHPGCAPAAPVPQASLPHPGTWHSPRPQLSPQAPGSLPPQCLRPRSQQDWSLGLILACCLRPGIWLLPPLQASRASSPLPPRLTSEHRIYCPPPSQPTPPPAQRDSSAITDAHIHQQFIYIEHQENCSVFRKRGDSRAEDPEVRAPPAPPFS